jgi:filamentous hemagglutinin family protein
MRKMHLNPYKPWLSLLGLLWGFAVQAQIPPPAPKALPGGAQVSAGQASILKNGASMVIQQGTDRASINWQSFNVGKDAQVQFQQPSAASVTLNRVMSSEPSQIFGRITANGQVILTNPAGVYFGKDARVDVGGLVATTQSISDADFMAGKHRYERSGSTGSVVNEGELKAALGGYIALLAPEVRNQGAIIARMGTVALAAGEAIDLHFDANNRLTSIRVEPSQIAALVDNRHAVQAPGGLIIISAQSMDRLVGGVIKNSGKIEAHGLQMQAGRIILSASRKVDNSGTISANATAGSTRAESGPAGQVEISAPEVVNSGTIGAAAPASQFIEEAVRRAGSVHIQATQFTQTNSGSIDLTAPVQGGALIVQATGQVNLQGQVDVSAKAAAPVAEAAAVSQGGQIEVSAGGDLVVNSATLDASGAKGGQIQLRAAAPVQPDHPQPLPDAPGQGRLAIMGNSTLSTRGRSGQGGSALLLGDHIELLDNTRIDATGATGGGKVLVGGDWQGGADADSRVWAQALPQASTVTLAADASIDASATVQGQGGTVVLWSDATRAGTVTTVAGSLTARGGAQGGDGGRVETSGYTLHVEGARVNAGADVGYGGQGGLWYLDPSDTTISQTVANSYATTLNTGTSVLNDVVGNITWSSGVTLAKTAGGDATLTLRAGDGGVHSITLTAPNISASSGRLNLVLRTRFMSATNWAGTIAITGGSITTNGGHIWMGGGATAAVWNGLAVGNTAAQATATSTVGLLIQDAQINTGAGHFYAFGQLNLASTSATGIGLMVDSSSITTTSGSVTLVGDILGSYSAGAGLEVSNSSAITTTSGSITLRGTASASNSPGGTVFATDINKKVTLSSDSGDIKLYGTTTANSLYGGGLAIAGATGGDGNQTTGVGSGYNVAVLSNSGNILLDASVQSTGSSGWQHSLFLVSRGSDKMLVKTTSGGITLKGSSSATRADSSGLQFQVDATTGRLEVVSGSGDIYLQGFQSSRSTATLNNAMRWTPAASAGSIRIGAASDTTAYTGNITIEADSIRNQGATTTLGSIKAYGTGAVTFSASGTASVKDFALTDNWDFGTGHSSFTIGKPTENKTVTLSAPLTAAGPITVYGGIVWLKDNLTSTQAGAKIRLIASNYIYGDTVAKTLSTNAGDVVLAADSDGNGFGNIDIYNGLTIDTRAIASGSTKSTALTGGGNVTLGGGNAGGTGYASGVDSNRAEGIRVDNGFYIRSGGGNISLRGRSWAGVVADGAGAWGVGAWGSGGEFVADAGTGKIYIEGISRSSGYGSVKQGVTVYGNTNFRSAYAGAEAITVIGKNTSLGSVYNYGIGLNEYDQGGTATIVASGTGGGITLDGYGNEWSLVMRRPTSLITNGGPLNLLGSTRAGGSGAGLYMVNADSQYWVSSADAAYSSFAKNGDLNIRFDRYSFPGQANVGTSGDVTWTSFADSFRQNVFTSWFNWNQNGQTMASLTIGKPTNKAADVNINGSNGSASNAVTVAGPVTAYGRRVTVSSPLTITGNGDISLRALQEFAPSITISNVISKTGGGDATLTLRAPGRIDLKNNITTSGAGTGKLNLVVWADDNADTKGGISISGDRTFSTNGGHVWFGGGRNAVTWNGLTVGDGAAGAGYDFISADLRGTFNTGGGDFYVAGKTNVNSSYRWDINTTVGNLAINTGSGDVTFVGNRIDFGGVYTSTSRTTINTTGVLTIRPWDDNFGHTFSLQGALTGANWVGVNTAGVTGSRGLTIQNAATLGGLVIGKDTNNSMVSVNSSLSIGGDISLYGGQIRNQSSASLTSTAGSILLDADLGRGVNFNGQGVNWTGGALVASSTAANQGNITIAARGGTKTSSNEGLALSTTLTAGGDVSLTGYAMTNGNAGLKLAGTVSAGGSLNLDGRNLSSMGFDHHGVQLLSGASLTSVDAMTITGHAGASYFAVALDNNVSLTTTGTAGNSDITLQALYGHVGSSFSSGTSVANRVTAGAGSGISIIADRTSFSATKAITLNTTGTLTFKPSGSSFWLPFLWNGTLTGGHFVGGVGMSNITIQNLADVGGLTLGKAGNNDSIVFHTAADIKGAISAYGSNITINQALTSNRNADSSKNRIVLQATGEVTQATAGVLTADGLGLLGTGRFTLTNTSNNVGTLAAGTSDVRVRSIDYVDANGLTIGTVNPTGIFASGKVRIETLAGDLAIAENINTSSTDVEAVILNAGKTKAVAEGSAFYNGSGGNITVATGKAVTVGSGGRATLYAGSVSGSTGLTAMVGSGSGRFRYASDELTTGYLSPLDEGVYAVYRQQPMLILKGVNETVVYGTEPFLDVGATGMQNGDTVAQSMGKLPTVTLLNNGDAATRNASGYYDVLRSGSAVVGYDMRLSIDAVSKLGYALSYDQTGATTVTPKTLTAVINDDAKFVGLADNAGYAGATFNGFVRGESVANISATSAITRTGMGANGGVDDALNTYTGALSGTINLTTGNYELPSANITAGNYYIVDHNTLIVRVGTASAVYGNPASYDVAQVRYYNNANTEVSLTQGSSEFNWNLAGDAGKAVDFSLGSAGVNVGTYGITGSVSTPHTLPNTSNHNTPGQLLAIGGRLTITPRTLTLSANRVYDGTPTLTGSDLSLGNLYNNETLTYSAAKVNDRNVATANKYVTNVTLQDGTGLASNYQLPSLSAYDATGNNATLTARALGVSVTKEYDGQTSAAAAQTTLTNLASGEGLTISGVTLGSARVAGPDANLATSDNFVSALSLADKGPFLLSNYSQPTVSSASARNSATISAKELIISSISATGTSKVYDGTTAADSSFSATISLSGFLTGESAPVTVNAAAYNSKNVADANQIGLSSVTLGSVTGSAVGSVPSDYKVDLSSAFVSGDISRRSISAAANANPVKVYDGTDGVDGAVVAAATATSTTGKVGSDDIKIVGVGGTFNSADAGTGRTYTLADISLSGADKGNYSLTSGTISGTDGVITPRPLTLTATKVYDATNLLGTRTVTQTNDDGSETVEKDFGVFTLGNLVQGEVLTISAVTSSSARVAGPDGNASTVDNFVRTITLTNQETFKTSNYSLPGASTGVVSGAVNTLTANASNSVTLSPATLTVSLEETQVSKVYDKLSTFNSYSPTYTVQGLVDGDTAVAVAQTGRSFNEATVAGATTFTASGLSITAVTGTLSSAASDYALDVNTLSVAGSITPRPVAVDLSAGIKKVYDRTTSFNNLNIALGQVLDESANLVTNTGLVSGDVVTVSASGGGFDDRNVGSGNKSFTLTGLSLQGADAGNYALASGSSLSGTNGTIDPKTVHITGVAISTRPYDGSTTATATGSAALLATVGPGGNTSEDGKVYTGDVVTLSGSVTSAAFASKNVARDVNQLVSTQQVSLSGLSLAGADAGNYTLDAFALGTINPAALSATPTLASKTYNAGTSLTVSAVSLSGFVGSETVTASGTGVLASANAGSRSATVSYTLANGTAGGVASNYSLDDTTHTVTVNRKALAVTGSSAAGKTYDGTTNATVTAGTLSGFVGSETVSASATGSFDSANAGSRSVTASYTLADGAGGGVANNYSLADTIHTATISAKALSISGTVVAGKVYDGSTTAPVSTTGAVAGLVSGESLTITPTAAYNTAAAGTGRTATVSFGLTDGTGLAANYTLANVARTGLTITAKTLNLSGLIAAGKVYDGTPSAAVALVSGVPQWGSLSGVVSGDSVSLVTSSHSASYDNRNAGTGKTVTFSGLTLSGSASGNYSIANQTTTANISPATLTIAGITASNKVYDGTSAASLSTSGLSLTGLVSVSGAADDVSLLSVSGVFDSKNVGTAKTVTLTETLTGADLSNYTVVGQGTTTADVTKAALNLSGASSVVKAYDGTTRMPTGVTGYVSAGAGSLAGVISGDTVSVTGSAAFASANVERVGGVVSGAVTALAIHQGTVALSGADAGNYNLSWTNGSGTITPAALSVRANNDARFLTQSDAVNFAGVSFSGFVNGETSAVLTGTASVSRPNASTDVLANKYTGALQASGLNSSNYAISYAAGDYTIVPSNQLLVRVTPVSNTYGTATAYALASVEYESGGTVYTLGSGGVAGSSVSIDSSNLVSVNDGASGTAGLTVAPQTVAGDFGTAGKLKVGSYQLGVAGLVTKNSANFSNTVTVVGSHQVVTKGLTASATGVSKVYDGTTGMSGVTLGLSTLETNDVVTVNGLGAFGSRHVGSNIAYTLSGLGLAGADAGNYHLTGGSSFSGNDGQITARPLLVNFSGVDRVYDGSATATVTTSDTRVSGDVFTITRSALFADKNVGQGKAVTVGGVILSGADAANYSVATSASTTANITRLNAVTWVGGASGNWFDPANWAGGAVPDLSNVAQVVIPSGVHVSFGSTVVAPAQSGPVQVDSLSGANASLSQSAGTLNVGAGGVTLDAYIQSGGVLTSTGPITLATLTQTNGSLSVTGNLTVTQDFSQATAGTMTVGGNTNITDTAGGLTIGNLNTTGTTQITSINGGIAQSAGTVIFSGGGATLSAATAGAGADIVLDGANDFNGSVNVLGGNDVTLNDINSITLGGVNITGKLDVTAGTDITLNGVVNVASLDLQATAGDITQSGGTLTVSAGPTDLKAGDDITLDKANDFNGSVNVLGGNDVTLNDINSITLGGVNITGKLDVTAGTDITLNGVVNVASLDLQATAGDITQASGTLTVAEGPTDLKAGDDITLDKANDFNGSVNVLGGNDVTLNDVSSLKLGNVAITGNLSVGSNGALDLGASSMGGNLLANSGSGNISQSGPLTVNGSSVLNAGSGAIELLNPVNRLVGGVTVTASRSNIVGDLMGQALAAQAAAKAQASLPVGQSPGSVLPGAASPQPLVMASGPAAGSSSSSGGALGSGGGANSSGVVIDLLSGQAAGTITMVAVSLPKGMATAGTGFGFELPESVRMMAEQAPQGIRAQASLPDGASLPSWLKFDPERQRFDASAVPDGAFPMQVVVSVALQRLLVVISERNE